MSTAPIERRRSPSAAATSTPEAAAAWPAEAPGRVRPAQPAEDAMPLVDTMVRAQVVLPGLPRIDAAEQAFALREARRARRDGTIQLGGKPLPRLAPAPTPLTELGQKTLNLFFDLALSPLPKGLGFTDWRSAETARRALETPPVPGKDGQPASLGELTIVRPGLGNLHPSAAQVFRAAQYSEKLVVAWPNVNDPTKNRLRPATHVDGVPVPPELRGKIFEIGSPDHHLISYRQSSDLFLQQLEAMRKDQNLLGLDVLRSGATVIGHSQGSLDTALTRKRLEEAGFEQAFGRVLTLAPPFKGSAFAEEVLGTVVGGVAVVVDNDDALRAIRSLDPEEVAKDFGPAEQRLVDLSLAGVVGPRPGLVPKIGLPPFEVRGNHNVRPTLRALAGGMAVADFLDGGAGPGVDDLVRYLGNGSYDSDGLVGKESAEYGRRAAVLEHPYDHSGIFEDPAVIDAIVRQL